LTLAFGDVTDILPQLRLAADAIYLDGFAPERNPDMWTEALMRRLARLARPGATVATYTTARAVREALAAAAFVPELRPGYGRKREMLAARFSPRAPLRHGAAPAPQWRERRAIVVGAGLAGAGAAERLAARGWAVELIERHAAPAPEASGMAAGIIHPLLARDDNGLARLSRAGFLYALDHWRALEEKGHRFAWTRCGVLQVGRDAREARRMADAVRALACPPGYASCKDGLWFPDGSWVRPAQLVAALIAAAGSRLKLRMGAAVHALERAEGYWRAVDAGGATIAQAPVAVLANSHDAIRLVPHGVKLKRVRGQLTCLPPGSISPPGAIVAGAGHLVPAADGAAVVGSTYDFEDDDPAPSAAGHAGNLERLELLLPGSAARLDPARLAGTVGFRCVTPDRLPLVGAAPDLEAPRPAPVPRLEGLYGAFGYASRGLTWSALGGELIASLVEGEPLPVEGDLADAIDPARFLLRRARRRRP
jgi:tRNA 5-methylaminomethyl-2-thiouridine biosynthesis bifunctional protein